jgi:hypothetical protein
MALQAMSTPIAALHMVYSVLSAGPFHFYLSHNLMHCIVLHCNVFYCIALLFAVYKSIEGHIVEKEFVTHGIQYQCKSLTYDPISDMQETSEGRAHFIFLEAFDQ